ncbi:hypothetical protein MRX96_029324 [Rhipicephalus microplus]
MQELFNPTHDESTSAVNGDPDEPHQPSEEDHWQITRIALERALPRISASTATGLDGIPAGLVKCLGKSAREHLAGFFNTILKNGPIPPDWQCGRVCVNHMHAQSMATGFKWTVAKSTGMDLFALVMT